MKKKNVLFLALCLSLIYLSTIDNISINIGDEHTYITQEEWFESNPNPINNFCEKNKDKEENWVDSDDFESYLKQMSNKPFYRHDVNLLDTTGDGTLEEVHSIIQLTNKGCEVYNYIDKNGQIIWEDRGLINEELATLLCGDKKLVDNYGPYALFYLGLAKSHFTEELNQESIMAGNLNQLKLGIKALYANKELTNIEREIGTYKGRFLFKIQNGNQQIYMWNKEQEAFITIHEFHPSLS